MFPLIPIAAVTATAIGATAVHHITTKVTTKSTIGYDHEADTDSVSTASSPHEIEIIRTGTKAAAGATSAREVANGIAYLGTDNYVQAGAAEAIHAKELARHLGGTVVDDGSSVYAADNGIDTIIQIPDDDITVQTKHFGEPLGDSIVKQYADTVDYIASTNGFKDSANPAAHGIESWSKADWSWRGTTELKAHQFIHGLRRLAAGVRTRLRQLVGGLQSITSTAASVVKHAASRLAAAGTAVASWFLALSLGQQLLVILAIIAVAAGTYYFYQWYTARDTNNSISGSAIPSL